MSGRRVAVVGGGVTGLVAALTLATDADTDAGSARAGSGGCGRGDEVVLLESGERLGGKLATTTFRSRPLDLGPDAFITRNDAARRLCEELGIGEELIAPSASSAAIFARGRLRPFPPGLALGIPTDLVALARSGIVTLPGAARAALDLLLQRRLPIDLAARAVAGEDDPTIAQVVAPRLGREVLERLVDPLLGGTNAGDSSELSFAAVAPALAERVAGESSLVRALRRWPLGGGGGQAPPAAGRHGGPPSQLQAASAGVTPPSLFLGLEAGLGRLAAVLAERCAASGVELRLGCPVTAVEPRPGGGGGYLLELAGGACVEVDGLILAVPASSAAKLVAPLAPELAGECAAIPYAGVALVTIAWPASALPAPLAGSGALVPRSPELMTTALTFVSTKWPRSARSGEAVVRASLGRHLDPRPLELDDVDLEARALDELAAILGVDSSPLEVLVQRWPASFPQYLSGHLARVARIEALEQARPGLVLAGAGYRGIGIPACVQDGRRAANRLSRALRPAPA